MQKIRIGIVEDETIIAHNIAALLTELGYSICSLCSNYDEAIEMMGSCRPDLVLLDINLSRSRDGIDVAKYIRANNDVPIIFLTANGDKNTVDRAKQVNPDAYLVKPFQATNLYSTIEIALYNFNQTKKPAQEADGKSAQDSLFIKEGNYFYKVSFDDVLYLSSDHVYVTVHTASKNFLVRSTMQEYLEKFDPSKFVRVHRSYVINTDKVEKINSTYLVVQGEQVPVSKNHRENLMALLNIN